MIQAKNAEGVFINLVRSIINEEQPSALPDGITADDIFTIGTKQDMAPIIFCALNRIKNLEKSDSWFAWQKQFLSDCACSEVQMAEYDNLIPYLCNLGVKVLPLKGCVIKRLYPTESFRVMSDIDLLYEGVSPLELSKIMEQAGYSREEHENEIHEVFHKAPCMNIELHSKLINDDSPYKSVLENMFEKAVPDESIPNLYHMKPEDLYIHLVVHAAKHFISSGLGIRPVLDFYVLGQQFANDWDRTYIDRQLESVGIERFERKIREIAYAFFSEESMEVSDEDMQVFFRGGTYGKYSEVLKYSTITSGNNNTAFVLKQIFLPLTEMKKCFPILINHPYLYPFASVYRWIDRLIHRTSRVKEIMSLNRIPSEEITLIKKTMKSFGLD